VVVIIWWLDLQLPMQSIPIFTNVVSSNPAHGEVYSFINSTCMNLHIFIYFWFKFEIRLIVCLFILDVKSSY
jgi:hypothetical protein